MDRSTSHSCRNCHSANVITRQQGVIAPFFLQRVHGLYVESLGERIAWKVHASGSPVRQVGKALLRLLSHISPIRRLLAYRSGINTGIQVCTDCGFISPDREYGYEDLKDIYEDYRSDSYDIARTIFEPEYAKLGKHVGKSSEEVLLRLENVDHLINQYIAVDDIQNVVDWGGGEGKFVPSKFQSKNVWILDVSTEQLLNPHFLRIDRVPENVMFDYAQVCHVLEHVGSPHTFVSEILSHINPGGFLYVEVPQDRPDTEIQKFLDGNTTVQHIVHEHLNLFTAKSLRALATSLGLNVLAIETVSMNFGWAKGKVISGLFSKP